MPIIFETGALLRPLFAASDFVPTKWEPVQAKADFANRLCGFIAADFKRTLFTRRLPYRLHMTFGLPRVTPMILLCEAAPVRA